MRGFISLLLLAGIFHAASAQSGFAPRQSVRSPMALPWQPAALGLQAKGQTTVSAIGLGGYGTNVLPLSLLPVYGDPLVLDSAFAESVTSHMGTSPLKGWEGAEAGLWITAPIKGRMFSVGLRQQQSLGGGLDQAQTARLLLHTNAGIDSLYETGLKAWASNQYTLSIGTTLICKDSFSTGIRLNLIGGTAYTSLQPSWLRYGYTHTPTQEEIRLSAQYGLFRAKGGSLPGMGASLDVGAVWQKGPWTLQGAVTNLGAMAWKGERIQDSTAITFSGVTVPDADSAWADSLLALLRPDTVQASLTQLLLPTFHVSAQYQTLTGWSAFAAASWTYAANVRTGIAPQVALGAGKSFAWGKNKGQQTSLMLTAAAGGISGSSLGATLQHSTSWGNNNVFRIFLSMDDYGLLNPEKATYTGGSAGISVGW